MEKKSKGYTDEKEMQANREKSKLHIDHQIHKDIYIILYLQSKAVLFQHY